MITILTVHEFSGQTKIIARSFMILYGLKQGVKLERSARVSRKQKGESLCSRRFVDPWHAETHSVRWI